MSTVRRLWAAAEAAGGDALVLAGPERLTFRGLGARIRSAAAALGDEWEVRPGDAVALLAPNGAAFVTGYFAVQELGGIALPLDARLGDDDLRTFVAHAGAVGVLAAPEFSARASRVCSTTERCLPLRLLEATDPPNRRSADSPIRRAEPPSHSAAELLYTSGTTAAPKGVLRSHENVLAAVRNARIAFGYAADDTIAIAMPLSHSSALTSQLLPVLQAGGRIVLLPQFDAAQMIETIAVERVTCVRLVPAMIRLLLAHEGFHARELPSLRLLLNSSAPVEPDDYRELKRRFAGIRVLNSYGLTEASTCTVLPDALALSHSESVGHTIEGVRVSVRREDGIEADAGEEGEVWVAGPHVFLGYHRDAAATAAARSGEWLRTGDLGRLDGDGMLFLSGRRDDMINCGGRKVAPELVERCVAAAPGVRDAACTAMPHRVLGQVVHAFVVPDESGTFDARAVVRHCAGVLPSHMVPFQVTAVTTLPRNAVGKLVRRRLPSAT